MVEDGLLKQTSASTATSPGSAVDNSSYSVLTKQETWFERHIHEKVLNGNSSPDLPGTKNQKDCLLYRLPSKESPIPGFKNVTSE